MSSCELLKCWCERRIRVSGLDHQSSAPPPRGIPLLFAAPILRSLPFPFLPSFLRLPCLLRPPSAAAPPSSPPFKQVRYHRRTFPSHFPSFPSSGPAAVEGAVLVRTNVHFLSSDPFTKMLICPRPDTYMYSSGLNGSERWDQSNIEPVAGLNH